MSLTAFNRRRRLTQEQEAAKKEGEAMGRQETTAPSSVPDYDCMSDEELMTLAIEKNIEVENLTRRKIINILKKLS